MTLTEGRARLALAGVVLLVFVRLFGAAFVEYDDDIHVYANAFLNPPSFHGMGQLWRESYKGLYNPLAYTIWGALALVARTPSETASSLGQAIQLEPGVFHAANIGFHLANVLLCFSLALRLTHRRLPALLAALVFAVHPLQVESVAWVSELRGLSSGCFALAALNLLVASRQVEGGATSKSRALLAASAVLVIAAMLCKPAAVVLPLVALVLDRVALGTSWRSSLTAALLWAACLLPLAVITLQVQKVHAEGTSVWWQRPFIAGDALAFYLFKTAVPFDLGVEYGRTPRSALSDAWGYVGWVLPAALLLLGFVRRRRHPLSWLGALLFVAFSLPTLGLVPFAFQAHSTVADRYAYLPLLGVGLVAADAFTSIGSSLALRVAGAALLALAVRSFDQTGYWLDNLSFMRHTIDVNPNVAFAQNNVANLLLKEKRVDEAIQHFEKALDSEPNHALAQNNLGLALVQQGRSDEAEPHFRKAVELDPKYYKAYESLGALYLRKKQFAAAVASLKNALAIRPSEAKALNDLGVAYMQSGQATEGVDAFQQAVAFDPGNSQYRKNLGTALAQLGRTDEAAQYLGD
jgi:Flp pilus assembly protein TadD